MRGSVEFWPGILVTRKKQELDEPGIQWVLAEAWLAAQSVTYFA